MRKSLFNFIFFAAFIGTFVIAVFTAFIFAPSATLAASNKVKKKEKAEDNILVKADKEVSSVVDNISHSIDIFLSGEKYTNKRNKSYVILKNGAYFAEGDEPGFATQVDLRLVLPNLEEKWSLRFTSYDEEEDERGINRNRPKTQAPRTNYGASIALLKKLGKIDVSFKPRVRIRDTLETSHLLRFESHADMKYFTIRPRLELFARSNAGTGELFALNFEIKAADNLTVIQSNEQEYVDYQNRLSTNNEIALHHILDDSKSLKYAFLVESNNKPNFHMERYLPYVSFVHSLYKNVLHYSVSPRMTYAESEHFRGSLGLSVGVDIIF